jgi:hypothetical protein
MNGMLEDVNDRARFSFDEATQVLKVEVKSRQNE